MEENMKLERVEGDPETGSGAFQLLYRQAVLLSLKEGGVLTEGQLRRAEEALLRRHGQAGEEVEL